MWRKIQRTLATLAPLILVLLFLAVTICFLNRWDSVVPITLIPIWAWAATGMILSLLAWFVSRGIYCIVMFTVFLITGLAFSEETRTTTREIAASLVEGKKPEISPDLRIVHVNCAGNEAALQKAISLKPDVLTIAEIPDPAIIEAATKQLFGVEGSFTIHKTNAIIAKGERISILSDPDSATIHVRLKHAKGILLDISNIDLDGFAPRLDMWKPVVWKELIAKRIRNRQLVRAYLGENEIESEGIARIICGGFGTPPGDDLFRPLDTSGMRDTAERSGQGWVNTFPAKYPWLRLDQIWVSNNLIPLRSVTSQNPGSDHRIVVSEVQIRKN
ncbi:MAG TPA: endonuclease/exonuclease/phosphatase family protein [Verrucomicrobiales bacterium]|nr:endonuclease/exonuclease/phosphatase family protein [Verrucomicrobiales bacterium]